MSNGNNFFTVKLDANTPQARGFSVNTHRDVLEGMSEDEIRVQAAKSKVINLQIPLRKCMDAQEMQEYLVGHGYPDAVVTDGIVKEVSAKSKVSKEFSALSAIVGEDEAMRILAEAIATAKSNATT